MKIFDVEIYRDGGSLEFRIEKGNIIRHIWLETPLQGEPRVLLIDSKTVAINSLDVHQLLSDLDDWWGSLPDDSRKLVRETTGHKGPYYNASAAIINALNISRVLDVRDYVRRTYIHNS